MSENTTAMKMALAYGRLLVSIIDKRPQSEIEMFLFEYAACDSRYRSFIDGEKSFEDYKNNLLELAKLDATNYYSHRQGGRKVLVPKNSPLGRKLKKGAFSEVNEE